MKLSVSASSVSALLESAAHQYLNEAFPGAAIGAALREKLMAEAPTREALPAAWLAALDALMTDQRMLFQSVHVQSVRETSGAWQVRADVLGELHDPHRHPVLPKPASWKARLQGQEGAWVLEAVRTPEEK